MDDIEDELDEIADQLGDSGLERGERDSLEETRHHLRRELRDVEARHGRAWRQEQAADDHATRLRIDPSRYYGGCPPTRWARPAARLSHRPRLARVRPTAPAPPRARP